MAGAVLLAGRAALKVGAGKVLVGFAQDAAPLACDPLQPELMLRDARSLLEEDWGITAWVAGCGIGTGALAANMLSELATSSPIGAPAPSCCPRIPPKRAACWD
ncbi:hypothetical protein G6F22_021296 [Rhizopus arrhizus]|nr:hypothetical protein G6F22_021296 [Rhizopus arrhizus]